MAIDDPITVIYYDDDDPLTLKNKVFQKLPVSSAQRVILPEGFRPNRTIIAVMEGDVKILSRLGDRIQYITSDINSDKFKF